MGQYHAIANLETGEAIYSHPMGDGLKLMEQGCSGGGGTLSALAVLLGPRGPWAGQRVAIVGDYAEVGDIPAGLPHADDPGALYEASTPGPEDAYGDTERYAPFTLHCMRMLGEAFGVTYTDAPGWADRSCAFEPGTEDDPHFGALYVVNLDKRQMLDPHVFGDGRNLGSIALGQCGTMLAVTILLAVSNGRGGGDFHLDHELVGSWGGDRLAIMPAPFGVPNVKDISRKVRRLICKGDRWAAESMRPELDRTPLAK